MSIDPLISEVLLLANLEPSDRPLLDLLFEHIDDSMLVEIAHTDYGDDVAIHLEALQQIRSGSILVPLQWHPAEVLCLTRWKEWDSLNTPETISQRNHWMRLFACTVLIWASLEPESYEYQNGDWNYTDGENSTIIQFLDSALDLGDDVSLAALKFLGWRMQCQIERALIHEDFGSCPCYAVAMLLLCVSLNQCNPEILRFLISMAYCNNEYLSVAREIDGCQRSQKWRDNISRIFFDPMAPNYARFNPDLQGLGMKLMGDAADSLS